MLNRQILLTFIVLVVALVSFELSSMDILIQDHFYNFETHTWLLDRNEPILKLIFYDGIKKLLIFIAVSMLFSLIIFRKSELIKEYRKGIVIVLLSAIFVPVIVGSIKAVSNTPCPKNIEHYNGTYPNIKVFDSYPKDFVQHGNIKCFPAGHASGGFALLSLFFLFKRKRNKAKAIGVAMIVGWSMGNYKMLIGDHYLSHTIITMILAWLIVLIIYKYTSKFGGKYLN